MSMRSIVVILLAIATIVGVLAFVLVSAYRDGQTRVKDSQIEQLLPLSFQPGSDLVEQGRELFFNETFEGNGRTCGTCHRAENNFTIDPAFIATLPGARELPLYYQTIAPLLLPRAGSTPKIKPP